MTDAKQLLTLQRVNSDAVPALWVDAPALAASTVDMENTSKSSKLVRVSGGTFTVVKVGPKGTTLVTLANLVTATPGDVLVRPGHVLNITYSVAPTVQWFEV
jgi:hypothetical protein